MKHLGQLCTVSGSGLATVGGIQWWPGQVVPALKELKDRIEAEEQRNVKQKE